MERSISVIPVNNDKGFPTAVLSHIHPDSLQFIIINPGESRQGENAAGRIPVRRVNLQIPVSGIRIEIQDQQFICSVPCQIGKACRKADQLV